MKGRNKIKYILWDLISNSDKINRIFWHDVLLLTRYFGVDRSGVFYVVKNNMWRYSDFDNFFINDYDTDDFIRYSWYSYLGDTNAYKNALHFQMLMIFLLLFAGHI